MVAATGDDKVNLVVSLLAKTEFAVPRVVARVNRAENEWLFTEQWGVDVAVSKPRLMAALVEEAVTVGDLVRLMTLPAGRRPTWSRSPSRGRALRRPAAARGAAAPRHRAGRDPARRPGARAQADDPLEAGDELIFVTHAEVEEQLKSVVPSGAAGCVDTEPVRSALR